MPTGDVTAESFSSRKVCIARAREHVGNRAYVAARNTLARGARQWPQLEFEHEYRTLLGQVAGRMGCLREANRLLSLAVRDEDSHVEARFLLGRVLLDLGRLERAVVVLSAILKDEDQLVPYRVHAGGALSVAYSALGLNKSSQDALEEAARFGLISAQLLADEGFRLLRVGAYPEAEVQLAKGLQVDSTCEDAFYRLSNALLIQGKSEPALEVLAYGIEQSPEYSPFYRLMAEIYTSRGQHKESAAFLRRALEISPGADDADLVRFMLAASLYRAGRDESALVTLRELLEAHPRTRLRREVAARIQSLEDPPGKSSRRIANFPRKLQKRSYCAPNTLANVLTFSGIKATQDDVAARIMRGAGTRWPELLDFLKDVKGIAYRGFFGTLDLLRRCIDNDVPVITTEYFGMSGHALAIIGYDDTAGLLIAQDPRFFEPVEIAYQEFLRSWQHDDGLCVAVTGEENKKKLPALRGDEEQLVRQHIDLLRLQADGETQTAISAARELAADAPEKQAPLRVLSELSLQARDHEQLRQICESALARWPQCFWARRHLGDACWMAGEPEAALLHYRKARGIDRRDESLSYALGELLISLGRRRAGRAFLVRALAEDPRYHKARLRLARDLADAGDTEGAIFHARLLVEYSPEDAESAALLAKLSGNTAVRTLSEGVRRVEDELARRAEAPPPGSSAFPSPDEEEMEIDLEDL